MNEITGRRPQRKRESPQAAPGCRSPRKEGRPGRERRRRARAAAQGGRLPRAGRARRRGRGGPRWAGARRAAGAAEEAGVGLPLPGRPHCSALALPFARLALPEGGVLWPNATPHPTPTSPNSDALAGPGRRGKFIIRLGQRGLPNSRAWSEEALQRAAKLEEAGQACNSYIKRESSLDVLIKC